jgi:hypothetical protein
MPEIDKTPQGKLEQIKDVKPIELKLMRELGADQRCSARTTPSICIMYYRQTLRKVLPNLKSVELIKTIFIETCRLLMS